MPEFRAAHLNGVQGKGYAEVVRSSGSPSCRGVIRVDFDGAFALMRAMQASADFTYTGVVYDGCKEHALSFPVIVRRFPLGGSESEVRFEAAGDPFNPK